MKFVSTAEELDQALEQIESDEYNKGKPEDFFWLDPELPKWKALLEGQKTKPAQNDPGRLNIDKSESVFR